MSNLPVCGNTKIIVLCFVGFYLPGYKAGGPLRTIANMVAHLKEDIEFWIVTRDRDLGDLAAYPEVRVNEWQDVQGARVYYLSPDRCTIKYIGKLISQTAHDVLYLNSFYDPVFTLKPMLARRFYSGVSRPCIVAPRGEFSAGAISLKTTKKRLFNLAGHLFNIYKGAVFQASSEHEALDIVKVLGVSRERIKIAIDLPELNPSLVTGADLGRRYNAGDTLRVIFLSRISPKKNLDFAIKVLLYTEAKIKFDIYGPVEDEIYWRKCQSMVEDLPCNVSVSYYGSVLPSETQKIFSQYDLFFFPTRGENYGHVIAESLSVGTPVLLSDQTPWLNLESQGLGWDLPLSSHKTFSKKIDQFSSLAADVRTRQRVLVQAQAIQLFQRPEIVEANLEMFRERLLA